MKIQISLLAAAIAISSHAMADNNTSDVDQTGFMNKAKVGQTSRDGGSLNSSHDSDIDQTGAFNKANTYQNGVNHTIRVNQLGGANKVKSQQYSSTNTGIVNQTGAYNSVDLNQKSYKHLTRVTQDGFANHSESWQGASGSPAGRENTLVVTQTGVFNDSMATQQGSYAIARVS
ncbi:hypothetical protein ACYTTR_21070, partial [Cobetia marina]